jgi:UDP-N-acetylmuramoylalanine--D-glutamate ligase
MREGELALVPKGLNLPKSNAFIVEYESHTFLEEYFNIDSSKIRFKSAFLEDALLALAVTRTLFDEVDYDTINQFKLDNHRQEEIRDSKDRLWVNDSKATNLDASIQAIKGYSDRFIRLIIGGDDKGADLTPLFELIKERDIKIYTIGSNSSRLASLATKYGVDYASSERLDIAVRLIDEEMESGDVALLSPASASYDQFKSYKHRGEEFFRFVKKI